MKQIYVESYYRSGYSRFMQYVEDRLEHPKRGCLERRLEIIKFFEEFGREATKRAFGKSRSTVYLGKQKLKKAGGKLSALALGDKTPIHKRKRVVHPFIERFIVEYRTSHPGADKATITPALAIAYERAGVRPVSESTVGRIILNLKERGRIPQSTKITIRGGTGTLLVREPTPKKKKMRRKGFSPSSARGLQHAVPRRPCPDGHGRYLRRRTQTLYLHRH